MRYKVLYKTITSVPSADKTLNNLSQEFDVRVANLQISEWSKKNNIKFEVRPGTIIMPDTLELVTQIFIYFENEEDAMAFKLDFC